MIKWLGKNWLKLIIVISIIVGLVLLDRACQDDKNQEEIQEKDEEISDLQGQNDKLEDEIQEALTNGKAAQDLADKKVAELAQSATIIKELRKKRTEVVRIVMELPPTRLVEDLREALDCAKIELFYFYPTDPKILFSLDCSRKALIMAGEFSLIKEELSQTQFSLSLSMEATQLQRKASWYFLGAAWNLGYQVLNYKIIVKKQDEKFSLLKKQKKRSWLDGAWKGFLAGVAVIVIINLARGR